MGQDNHFLRVLSNRAEDVDVILVMIFSVQNEENDMNMNNNHEESEGRGEENPLVRQHKEPCVACEDVACRHHRLFEMEANACGAILMGIPPLESAEPDESVFGEDNNKEDRRY